MEVGRGLGVAVGVRVGSGVAVRVGVSVAVGVSVGVGLGNHAGPHAANKKLDNSKTRNLARTNISAIHPFGTNCLEVKVSGLDYSLTQSRGASRMKDNPSTKSLLRVHLLNEEGLVSLHAGAFLLDRNLPFRPGTCHADEGPARSRLL